MPLRVSDHHGRPDSRAERVAGDLRADRAIARLNLASHEDDERLLIEQSLLVAVVIVPRAGYPRRRRDGDARLRRTRQGERRFGLPLQRPLIDVLAFRGETIEQKEQNE